MGIDCPCVSSVFSFCLQAWAKQIGTSPSPPSPIPKAAIHWELSIGDVTIRDEKNTEKGHLQGSSVIRNN